MSHSPVWDFRGESVLISGGARGIGAGLVRFFARSGALVLFGDQDAAGTAELCDQLAEEGTPVHGLEINFLAPDAWKRMREEAERLGLRPGLVISNVGVGLQEPLEDTSLEALDRVLAINLRSACLAAQEMAPLLRQRRGASLLLIGSVMASFGTPRYALYTTTKAALSGLVRSLAVELAPEVRVNLIVPGYILNDPPPLYRRTVPPEWWRAFHDRFGEEAARANPPLQPLPFWGEPEDIAEAAAFLHSARYITGTELRVDGGLLCQTPIRENTGNDAWEWTEPMREWLQEHGLPEPPPDA